MSDDTPLTWDLLLGAYTEGYFPMAEHRGSPELYWFRPEQRGIIPLDDIHIPKSLAKFARKNPFRLTMNTAFPDVIKACADRPQTWINDRIITLYCELWERGFAHSVECWREKPSVDGSALSHAAYEGQETRSGGNILVGGVYGIALGRAFFAESMFSRTSGASKVALMTLLQLLRDTGYELFDTQYLNPHLLQFGAVEIPASEYKQRLDQALKGEPNNAS